MDDFQSNMSNKSNHGQDPFLMPDHNHVQEPESSFDFALLDSQTSDLDINGLVLYDVSWLVLKLDLLPGWNQVGDVRKNIDILAKHVIEGSSLSTNPAKYWRVLWLLETVLIGYKELGRQDTVEHSTVVSFKKGLESHYFKLLSDKKKIQAEKTIFIWSSWNALARKTQDEILQKIRAIKAFPYFQEQMWFLSVVEYQAFR